MARDDFTAVIKTKLAQRVGYRCSIPGCRIVTVGPSEETEAAVNNIGMASHIYGAVDSPRSPRSHPGMNSTSRRSIENGIWTCRNCGTKIDNDTLTYTPEKLIAWRIESEAYAKSILGSAGRATNAERKDRIIANVYYELTGRFLVFFRLVPVFISSSVALSQKAKHAFGVPEDGNPLLSFDAVTLETEILGSKYIFIGTSSDRGKGPILQTLAIDSEVLKEIVESPIESLLSNAQETGGQQLTVLQWLGVLASEIEDRCNELLTRYAAVGDSEIIEQVELLKNMSKLVGSFQDNGNANNLKHTKQFVHGMLTHLLWLHHRFEELRKLPQ